MKRVFVFLVVLSVALSLFASGASEDGGYAGVTDTAFVTSLPADPDTLSYKLHNSPASLADNRLIIQLPSIAIDGNNIATTISKPSVAEAVSNLMKFKINKENIVILAAGIIENVGSGYNSIGSGTIEVGAAIGHFAFGIDGVLMAKTKPASNSSSDAQGIVTTGVVPMFDLAATVAFGSRVLDMGSMFLNVGTSVRFVRRSYMKELSASRIIDEGLNLSKSGAYGGYAIPIDLDVDFGILNGDIKFSVSANNLNGYYYMAEYTNIKDAVFGTDGKHDYKIYTPWKLNFNVELTHKWSLFQPKLTLGFNDILGYFELSNEKNPFLRKGREVVRFLYARIDLRLVKFVKLNAAFSNGYLSFGGALDFYGNSVELSYGFHEAGSYYGEKPVDTLTLRFKFGFDNN